MAAFDLQRLVDAQADVVAQALAELRAGAKTSHWMWFVFPQHRALGRFYAGQPDPRTLDLLLDGRAPLR